MATTFDMHAPKVRIQKRPKNPQDKCTVVSIFPLPIIDYKPTAFPQTHRIEGAKDGDFEIAVVEGASWYREMDEPGLFLEIPIFSTEVARAFIQDYVNGLPEYIPGSADPGLFFVLGAQTKETIKKYTSPDTFNDNGVVVAKGESFDSLLTKARARQKEWYTRSVNLADKDWARSNGNPLSISQISRIAAEKLGIQDKPWLSTYVAAEKSACPACGTFINLNFPVCSTCGVIINEARAKELNLKFISK